MSRFRAITPARRHALRVAVGAGIAAAVLWGAPPARAVEDIPYSFGDGLEFEWSDGNTSGSGELTGSFTLDCSNANITSFGDCVTYDANEGWLSFAVQGSTQYYYKTLESVSVSWAYDGPALTSVEGIYGYTADGVYFIQFYDVGDSEYVTLFLNDDKSPTTFSDPLPAAQGGKVPVTESVTVPPPGADYFSTICENPLPPPASISCPPGKTVALSNFNGSVINLVPSPFGAVLLLPALLLGRLRRRYAGQISR